MKIGITHYNPSVELAVANAGGTPFYMQSGKEDVDGIVLPGGTDINPAIYGEKHHPKTQGSDTERDELEVFVARRALEADIPILGICRGHQLLNAISGGTLIQDIRSIWEVPSELRISHYQTHRVKFQYGHRYAELGEDSVNSSHHQCIATLGTGWQVVAYSLDLIVEAIELPSHRFAVGVQWHPEWAQKTELSMRLFREFIDAAR